MGGALYLAILKIVDYGFIFIRFSVLDMLIPFNIFASLFMRLSLNPTKIKCSTKFTVKIEFFS